LQIARGEAKGNNNSNLSMDDALSLNAPPQQPQQLQAPPPQQQSMPATQGGVNPYEAQIAQQVALQQQLQAQLQQQLHMQQMQQFQMQAAQQAAAQQPQFNAQQLPNNHSQNGMGYSNGYAQPQPLPAYPNYNGQQPQLNGAPSGARPVSPQVAQRPSPLPAPQAPVANALPATGPAGFAQMQDQLNRLEKTLAAQARALRSLVEVLVEKGLLSKVEMARKQQQNGGK
jgi:hypothetical protein